MRDVLVLTRGGEPWKEVHTSIFGKKPRIEEFTDEAFANLEYRLAKAYILRSLARKSYSSFEMKKSLEERLVSDQTATQVVEEMIALGYINDDDWISFFISAQKRKKQGPKMIALKLKAKGVPEEEIEKHLIDESQEESILLLLSTKYRTRDLSDFKEKNKVVGSLLRRGFDYEEVKAALQKKGT